MKKTLLILTVAILVLGTMALSFADASFSPAKIFGDLTGKTEEEAYDLRLDSGKTFGTLAEEAGVYDEFFAATLETKTAYINDLVATGKLTQVEADKILENLANCDGTQQHLNQGIFGQGRNGGGQGRGAGMMNGGGCNGSGAGAGRGMMRGNQL